ncbi:hypothetical protein KUTeg_002803 [Tegillarca granosa]|uniref:Uncharacterized protein n=1 Tax=Tegillarca granosa TaxID=220873 RepID=A0ABQ9FTM6_TEGGR|nr:hypothetical protein KUTeg_002803 [Tegillarca granosa]
MSSQKGNVQRKRPQKHQNTFGFKNTLHDKTQKTKQMNNVELTGLCQRCKDVIHWKIKYKKYKPLTQAKTCTKCSQKNIKQAYYVICSACASAANVCCKCLEKKEVLEKPGISKAEEMSQESQLKQELEMLPERKRRTFFRLQASGKLTEEKIKELNSGGEPFDFDDFDGEDNSDLEEAKDGSDIVEENNSENDSDCDSLQKKNVALEKENPEIECKNSLSADKNDRTEYNNDEHRHKKEHENADSMMSDLTSGLKDCKLK